MSEHLSRVRKLYKFILRLHRNLPEELRILGDSYAKEEFKRHKKCKPEEAHIFLNEWREYAMSLSRQAAPARAERPRRNPEEMEARDGANPVREVGQEGVEQGGVPKRIAAAQAWRKGEQMFPIPRFGHSLTPGRVLHMTPDQLLSFYELQCHARGIAPPEELIDEGIDLVEADKFAKKIDYAQKNLLTMVKSEKEKLLRGEIKFEDLTIQSNWLVDVFDQAVKVKDKAEEELAKREMVAIDRERIRNEKEAKKINKTVKNAKKEE